MNNTVKSFTILLFVLFFLQYFPPAVSQTETREDTVVPSTETESSDESLKQETEVAIEVIRLMEMVKLSTRNRPLTNVQITQALVDLGAPAVPALISEMEKGQTETMPIAMYALGMIGDERAIIPLYNLLPPVEEEVQELPAATNTKNSICFTLGALGDVNSIPLIMQGPHAANMKFGAATTIEVIASMLGERSIDPLIDAIQRYTGEKKAHGAISAMGRIASERAIPFLKSLLEHQDDMVKKLAIEALARIGDPSTSESIFPFFESKDDLVREAAAESMYYFRDKRAVKKLTFLALNDPTAQVRLKAILSLGSYASDEAFMTLAKATEDTDVVVRIMATEWLGKSGIKKAEPFIKKRIKDIDARVALRAILSYEELLGSEGEAYLIGVLNDTRWVIQRESVRALTRLRSTKAAAPIMSLLKSAYEEQEKNPNFQDIVFETLVALSEIGDAKTLRTLKELAPAAKDPQTKQLFDGAMNDLSLRIENGNDAKKWRKVLEDSAMGNKTLAIDLLGRMRDRSATALLIDQFGKMDTDLSSSIPKALGLIKDPAALPFLEDLITNPIYDREKIYPARANAAWAIGQFGASSSIEALKKCLNIYDGEPFSAIVAIAKIQGKDALPFLYEIKARLMRAPSQEHVTQYDNINWLIRHLKSDWSISALDKEP